MKYFTKNKQLRKQPLMCGYVETKETKQHWKKLYFEHSTYFVFKGNINEAYLIFKTFESNELTKARIFYNKSINKQGDEINKRYLIRFYKKTQPQPLTFFA